MIKRAVRRFLNLILKVQTAYPLPTLLVALVLAAFSVYYTITNLGFQTNQKDLIYPDNRLIQLSEKIRQFDELDTFVVAIQGPDQLRSLKFLNALAPRLEGDRTHYRQIFYRSDPGRFKPWALLYLKKDQLLNLSDSLEEHRGFLEGIAKDPGLVGFFEQINYTMTSRMVGKLFTGYLDDSPPGVSGEPFDLTFLIQVLKELNGSLEGRHPFRSPWDALFTGEFWKKEAGYFRTDDKRYLLLFVTPAKKSGFADTQQSLDALRKTIAETQKSFPDIQAGVTGQEALNADQMGTAFADMSTATLISLAALTMLLVLFWKGLRKPLLEMTRLIIDLALTFGLTTLFIGHLNILSVTFAPLNLGLGIDYGAHWMARYQEEEKKGFDSKQKAIRVIMEKLGPGLLLAGLNASLSFFPLVLTGFKGLVELGLICAMGMIVTTVTSLTLLPALILLFDKPRKRPSFSSSNDIKPFLTLNRRTAFIILAVSCTALLFSAWGAGKVRFDLNMLHLQSPKVESVLWEKKLLESSDFSSLYGAVTAGSMEEVRKKKKALESLPTVSKVQSLDDLLPDTQMEKIAILRTLEPLLAGVTPFPATGEKPVDIGRLEDILGRIRYKMSESNASPEGISKPLASQMIEVRTLIDRLESRLNALGQLQAQKALKTFEKELFNDLKDKMDTLRINSKANPMTPKDLPQELRDRFIGHDGTYLMRVFPRGDIWEPAVLGKFVDEMKTVDPDAAGDPVTLFVFTRAFRDGCIKAAIYAVIFIFIFLLLTYRSLKTALLALLPLLFGTLWTLGFMHVFRINLNLANSLFLPLIVGAGVEYGIIILHRWLQREKDSPQVVLPFSTAMGILLAGLTTTVGFVSLCISSHQGIFSLGMLTTIGSVCIMTAAILVLPAFLLLSESSR